MSLFTGYVIAEKGHRSSYLEWNPALKRFDWLASSLEHATLFSRDDAEFVNAQLAGVGEILSDPLRRPIWIGGRGLGDPVLRVGNSADGEIRETPAAPMPVGKS